MSTRKNTTGSMFLLTSLTALQALSQVLVMDDEDAGYSTSGAWTKETANNAYNQDQWYQSAANNGATATWSFSNLPPGKYYLSASWVSAGTRTPAATYTMSDSIPSVVLNQSLSTSFSYDDYTPEIKYTRLSEFNGYIPRLITDGTLSVTASSSTNSYYLIADSVRLERAPDDVLKVYVVDNEDATGYSETGAWNTYSDPDDHRVDYRYTDAAAAAATFTFTGLEDGLYRVSATWRAASGRPNDATYIVPGSGSRTVNQKMAPSEVTFEGSPWNYLFHALPVSGGTVSLVVTNPPGGSGNTLIADAIRLEKIDTAYVRSGFQLVEDFETHAFGSAISSTNGWVIRGSATGTIVSNETGQAAQLLNTLDAGYHKRLGLNTIATNKTGTLFFRMRSHAANALNTGVYLTDWNWVDLTGWKTNDIAGLCSVSSFGDGTAVRAQMDSGTTNDIVAETWYNVWVVADTQAKTFSVYLSRGTNPAMGGATSVTVGTNIPFRHDTTELNHFMLVGTKATSGQGARIDDIYMAQGTDLNLPKPLRPPNGTMVSFK